MKKIGDLEGDERALQKETQGRSEKQEAELERRLKGQLDDFIKREEEKLEKLKERLAQVPTGDPESALSEEIERALPRFEGVRRRLEIKGEANGVLVVDDFAHHPTAVKGTLQAARARFPGRRIWALFEPRSTTAGLCEHSASPTKTSSPSARSLTCERVYGWPNGATDMM